MPRKIRIGYPRAVRISGDQGSYALTGQSAGTYVGRKVAADQGAYAVAGQDAALSYSASGTPSGSLSTLTLYPSSTGTLPYEATVYPAEGAVPTGYTIRSSDDANLRASVLAAWPDGSASVMVVSGEATVTSGVSRAITLQAQSGSDTPLTASAISAAITSIAFDFGAVGSATLSSFGSPERTWWANSRVICARYRQAIGGAGLEAVIDVHAYASGRAWVEVVIENCKMDSASPVAPSAKSYTGATVSVNGATIATVSNPATTNDPDNSGTNYYAAGTHEPFRAWYCSGWVGGDPGIEVTHDTATIQAHPLLYGIDQDASVNLQTLYESFTYTPWYTGEHRRTSMGRGGGHQSIGPLPMWDARYLQSGNRYARRAVLANALAALSFNVNYRDATSGAVPSLTDTGTKTRAAGTWPQLGSTSGTSTFPAWEIAHHPAVGLMAFLCRPSPCFIEIAQKVACWNGTYSVGDWSFGPFAQTRGRAWSIRSQAHAIFLTPDAHPWKAPGRTALANAFSYIDGARTLTNNPLELIITGDLPADGADRRLDFRGGTGAEAGLQHSIWEHMWLAGESKKAVEAKVLTGTPATAAATFTDWALKMPVRQVNESARGEWRYQRYFTTVGRQNAESGTGSQGGWGIWGVSNPDSLSTWDAQHAWSMTGLPVITGGFRTDGFSGANPSTYTDANYPAANIGSGQGDDYPAHFWNALVMAVERGVSGAENAWAKVTRYLSNAAQWRAGFATDPRQGSYPRAKARGALPSWAPAAGKFKNLGQTNSPGSINPDPAGTAIYSINNTGGGYNLRFDIWCSGMYVPTLGAHGSFVQVAGGNNGYDGNDAIQLEINARTWALLNGRTPYLATSIDDNGFPDGESSGAVNIAVGTDGRWIGSETANEPQGQPYIPHVYSAVEWLPPEADGSTKGSICFISRSQNSVNIQGVHLWKRDVATGFWARRTLIADGTGTAGNTYVQRAACVYDPYRRGLWFIAQPTGPYGSNELLFYSWTLDRVTTITLSGTGSWRNAPGLNWGITYHEGRDCIVIPYQAAAGVKGAVSCIDLSTVPRVPSTAESATHFNISYSGTPCPSMWQDRYGGSNPLNRFEYVPRDQKLYTLDQFYNTANAARLFTLTPPSGALTGTWAWASEVLTGTLGSEVLAVRHPTEATVSDGKGVGGNLRWVPTLQSLLLYDGRSASGQFTTTWPDAQLLRPAAFT